jgi:CRISPR-associated protein Cas2
MVVLLVQSVSPSLRGLLTRWFIEPRSGVYVGTVSSRVRDLVWVEVKRHVDVGSAVLIHRSQNEQGFVVLTHGDNRREVVDMDGLQLIRFAVTDRSPGP